MSFPFIAITFSLSSPFTSAGLPTILGLGFEFREIQMWVTSAKSPSYIVVSVLLLDTKLLLRVRVRVRVGDDDDEKTALAFSTVCSAA